MDINDPVCNIRFKTVIGFIRSIDVFGGDHSLVCNDKVMLDSHR